ncbi:uncharacterized protein LOC143249652 [Tachypleus tridentatus]|uniref:uncharacterized protein LOC143249652 n=1 Tax=Tachypleus tridentatus TaxID=6853 RepID=UPI003FD0F110
MRSVSQSSDFLNACSLSARDSPLVDSGICLTADVSDVNRVSSTSVGKQLENVTRSVATTNFLKAEEENIKHEDQTKKKHWQAIVSDRFDKLLSLTSNNKDDQQQELLKSDKCGHSCTGCRKSASEQTLPPQEPKKWVIGNIKYGDHKASSQDSSVSITFKAVSPSNSCHCIQEDHQESSPCRVRHIPRKGPRTPPETPPVTPSAAPECFTIPTTYILSYHCYSPISSVESLCSSISQSRLVGPLCYGDERLPYCHSHDYPQACSESACSIDSNSSLGKYSISRGPHQQQISMETSAEQNKNGRNLTASLKNNDKICNVETGSKTLVPMTTYSAYMGGHPVIAL